MDFVAVVDQVMALLRQRGRVAYRTLQRQFQLDDEVLEDLKIELIDSQRLATDEQGTVLVWTGAAATPPVAPAGSSGTAGGQPPLAYTPPYLAEKILTSRTALEGERKQVTVLFADLKDSTELIRGLDPEAAQQLLDPALHIMMDAVHRFEGTVNQVLGDGIMALFGAPIAHEDHALRACYAALAMQAAMQPTTEAVRRTRGLELRMRVGLNSGEVVVRAIGNDLHMDYSAVGETTHLAARMEQLATPGSIRLTPNTLGLVEGLVRVHALGPVPGPTTVPRSARRWPPSSRPSRPSRTCPRTAIPGGWPSTSASLWQARWAHWESMGSAAPCWARPRPGPGRSTIGPGWDGCWPGWPLYSG
jgi:class 3 adenylate cyclase